MIKIQDTDVTWSEKISQADLSYNFQPALTSKLDNHSDDFTEKTILEIVLWKTNRYPDINNNTINEINELKKSFTLEKAKALLKHLLSIKGFDLPMASTVLRFACPDQLQIIDQRVYRFIMPAIDNLKIPYNKDQKINLYFEYIDHLKIICKTYNIPFNKSDRILYQLDKELNSETPIKY